MNNKITVPDDYTLGLQKLEEKLDFTLPTRSNEDLSRGRIGFINRKDDRFTFSVRFYYGKKNADGKRWGKWQNLNSFSATIKNGRLNLFFRGACNRGKNFHKVVNITRQPHIIYKAYDEGSPTVDFLREEFSALYKRQNLENPFENKEENFLEQISKATYPAWGKNLKARKNGKIELPPLFVTDIMREETDVQAFKRLTTPKEENLLNLLLSMDKKHSYSPYNLWLLAVSRKRLTEAQRIELVQTIIRKEDWYSSEQYVNITADSLAQVRSLLKAVDQKDRFSIIHSSNNSSALESAITLWRYNKYKFKNTNISELLISSPEGSLRWIEVREALDKATKDFNKEGQEETQKRITSLLNELLENNNYLTLNRNYLEADINQRYYNVPLCTKEYRNNAFRIPIASKNPQQSAVFKILQSINPTYRIQPDNHVHVTNKEFVLFLEALKINAEKELLSHKLEASEENIALYIATFMIMSTSDRLNRFNGFVPTKWFTLIRNGLSPYAALLFVEKRIANKAAFNFVDVPDNWIARSFGISFSREDDLDDLF